MSKDFSRIKRALSMSTTLPTGTGGGMNWLELAAASQNHHHGHHHHHHDGCCDHDHHSHDHASGACDANHEHDESCKTGGTKESDALAAHDESDCDEDNTSPTGGCGCC